MEFEDSNSAFDTTSCVSSTDDLRKGDKVGAVSTVESGPQTVLRVSRISSVSVL
jgi:hypothetical protein